MLRAVLEERRTPVSVGQLLDVVVEGRGKQGDAFVIISGFVVFIKQVPITKDNERIKIRVIKIKSNCGIAVYEE